MIHLESRLALPLDPALLENAARQTLAFAQVEGEVELTLVIGDDRLLQQYNLLDSHDTPRIRSQLKGNDALHRLADFKREPARVAADRRRHHITVEHTRAPLLLKHHAQRSAARGADVDFERLRPQLEAVTSAVLGRLYPP